MEKQLKLKNIFLKALPKAVAAVTVTFQKRPFSPGRDHKLSRQENTTKWLKPHNTVSMIPVEARRKSHDRVNGIDEIYYQEPTSPKISCMGQIKHKKKQIKKAKTKEARNVVVASDCKDIKVKKRVSKFQKMLLLHGPKSEGRKSDASAAQGNKDAFADRAPHVSQMRRFSSGREAFANFDWKEEIDYYSDEERVESDDTEEEEIIIPFSAPILVGGGGGGHGEVLNLKPRKEINLWKRRTMAPPRPLQLDPVFIKAN